MVIRKLDAPRRVVNPRLPTSRLRLKDPVVKCPPQATAPADPLTPNSNPATAFEAAFAGLQAELPVIQEQGRVPKTAAREAYTYALWEDINENIRPILGRHAFSLRFRVRQDVRSVTVTAALVHYQGRREETELTLPVDFTDGKNSVQAIGSSVSYGKRYTASLLLNLTTRGDDDDGRAASGSAKISVEQVAALREQLVASGKNEKRLLAYLKIAALENLRVSLAAVLSIVKAGRGAS